MILAAGPVSIDAVVKVTRSIPVIAIDLESDPVTRGWIASLAHPGANVTGFFLDIPEMSGKQRQFLQEAKPKLSRVAVLGDARVADLQFKGARAAISRCSGPRSSSSPSTSRPRRSSASRSHNRSCCERTGSSSELHVAESEAKEGRKAR